MSFHVDTASIGKMWMRGPGRRKGEKTRETSARVLDRARARVIWEWLKIQDLGIGKF